MQVPEPEKPLLKKDLPALRERQYFTVKKSYPIPLKAVYEEAIAVEYLGEIFIIECEDENTGI